jgi:hypothetical protein
MTDEWPSYFTGRREHMVGIKTPEEFREHSLFDLLENQNAEANSGRA